jgi:hypothetical protein
MFAAGWRRQLRRLYDLDPQPEHAEAVVQWQSRARWLMWEAAFGLALWHSGDSAVRGVTNRPAIPEGTHAVDFRQ